MIRQETRHIKDPTSNFDTFETKQKKTNKQTNTATKNIFYLLVRALLSIGLDLFGSLKDNCSVYQGIP